MCTLYSDGIFVNRYGAVECEFETKWGSLKITILAGTGTLMVDHYYVDLIIFGASFLVAGGIITGLLVRSRLKNVYEKKLAVVGSEKALLDEKLSTRKAAMEDLSLRLEQRDEMIHQLRSNTDELSTARAALEVRVGEKTKQLEKTEQEKNNKEERLQSTQDKQAQLMAQIAGLKTLLEDERKQAAEKIDLLNEARDQLKNEFQTLAQKIFEEKSEKFTEQNRISMDHLITPLRDQIGDFKKRVEDVYDKEVRDRTSLQSEIQHLKELNQRISKEAVNLTKALKGDSKARGNWGEVVLERVLEASGLQKGREYETQVSLKDQDGKRYLPDVIVRLPQGKDVVVDAKVSLKDYEIYYSAEDPEAKESALKSHIESIRVHIRSLAGKNYDDLEGVRTLDFVLMFIPIEAAFLAAVEKDRNLFSEAFEKNIMVVSPSTLLVTLRTIESIWRHEYQNRNAIEIAKKAGAFYDKFVGFVDALEEVGRQLEKAKSAHEKAYNRLSSGRGNLIRRSEELKDLGVKAGKEMPRKLLDMAQDE